jgi:hypothetical protein
MLGLWEEAIVAATTAILFDIIESATTFGVEERDIRMELLMFLGMSSKGVVSFGPTDSPFLSKRRQNLISKLVRMISQHKQAISCDVTPAPPKAALVPSLVVKSLLQANCGESLAGILDDKFGISFSLGSILHGLFTKHSVAHLDTVDLTIFEAEATSAFVLIMNKMGQDTQYDGNDLGFSCSDYRHVFKLVVSSTQRNFGTEHSCFQAVVKSLIYVDSSVSLLPWYSMSEFDGLSGSGSVGPNVSSTNTVSALSSEYATKALGMLTDVDQGSPSDWSLILLSVRIAVRIYGLQISNMLQLDTQYDAVSKAFDEIRELARRLEETESVSRLVSAAKYCAMQVTLRLSDALSYEGNDLDAAQTALWSQEIASDISNETMKCWLESTTLLRSVTESVVSIGPILEQSDHHVSIQTADCESSSSRLRVALLCVIGSKEHDSLKKQFLYLLTRIDHEVSEDVDAESVLIFQWTKSTVILGLAEWAERQGDFDSALRYLKECYTVCKDIGLTLRSRVGHIDAPYASSDTWWRNFTIVSLHPRVVVRQMDCLYRLAFVHHRLGDHRKALGYAESLLNGFGARFEGDLGATSSFAQLLLFFKSTPCTNHRERQLRRIFLSLKSKSTPLDLVCEESQGWLGDSSFLPVQYPQWREKGSSSHDIEDIFDRSLSEYSVKDLFDFKCLFSYI